MLNYQESRLQVRQNALIAYTYTEYNTKGKHLFNQYRWKSDNNLRNGTYKGELTNGAKKRLTKAIELLCQSIKPHYIKNPVTGHTQKHRLSFITLTVSQTENLTARQVYDTCFKHFLQWLRRTEKVSTYVWKCEVQKRGQIHYHITTPSWIHYQHIKDKWNNLQRSAGYVKEFKSKYGHDNPNSTDIKEVKNVKNLSGYLLKEFCKSIQNPHTTGKVWDCSLNLKKYKYYTLIENQTNNTALTELLNTEPSRFNQTDFCTIISIKQLPQDSYLTLHQMKNYDHFLHMIRTYKRE